MVRGSAINNAMSFSYVVGANGNYPATLDGLQAALTDANGTQPVFIQEPGVPNPGGSGTQIIMPSGTVIVGAFNEMPADALTIESGSFTSNQDPSSAAGGAHTIIDANLVPAGNGNYAFYNICLSPGSWDGLVVPQGNTIVIYQIKNSWICSASGQAVINAGGRTTGNGVLYIYLSNSLLNNRDGSRLIDLSTGGGSAQLNFFLANNAVVYSANSNSNITGPNVNYFLRIDSGSSYIDAMDFDTSATGCTFNWSFLNAFIGSAVGDPILTDNTGALTPTLSMQQTSFMADNAGGSASVFAGIPAITLQYTGSGNYSQGITLQNFPGFSTNAAINEQILVACAGITVSGNFTPTLLFGGGNTGQTGTYTGTYVRNGRQVDIQIIITLTAKGSSTGTVSVGGLPFAATTLGSTPTKYVPCYFQNWTASPAVYTSFAAVTSPGNHSFASIEQFPLSAVASLSVLDSNLSNTSIVTITGTYWTD